MRSLPDNACSTPDCRGLSAAEMARVIGDLQQQLSDQQEALEQRERALEQRDTRIEILEELLRQKQVQQFAASSEQSRDQIILFDEAELEVEIDALRDQLPETARGRRRAAAPPRLAPAPPARFLRQAAA